jgi:uncharacterized protein (TIGR00255 family)
MMNSMTGYGVKESEDRALGKICVELKSTNHKFFEVMFHLPEGFMGLEDKIKAAIESKIKRGRINCSVTLGVAKKPQATVNRELLKSYASLLKNIAHDLRIKEDVGLDTLLHLPGVLSSDEAMAPKAAIWPQLKSVLNQAINDLAKTRRKEGRALEALMRKKSLLLRDDLRKIKSRYKIAVQDKLKGISSGEERSSFLKSTDITEEVERLAFHVGNFQSKLAQSAPMGKELDFIAQEMQREANTIAAKQFDVLVSANIVQIKSLIEKIREQAQNIE